MCTTEIDENGRVLLVRRALCYWGGSGVGAELQRCVGSTDQWCPSLPCHPLGRAGSSRVGTNPLLPGHHHQSVVALLLRLLKSSSNTAVILCIWASQSSPLLSASLGESRNNVCGFFISWHVRWLPRCCMFCLLTAQVQHWSLLAGQERIKDG